MNRHVYIRPPRDRRGFALAVALMAVALVGAMVVGGYVASMQDFRTGRNALMEQRALSTVELGLDTVYATWSKSWNSALTGTTRVLAYTTSDGGVDTVRITKLNQLSFLVVSEGRAGGQGGQLGSRRRAGMIVRLNMPRYNQPGALVSRGTISISGNTAIHGTDTTYAGWDCPPAGAGVAGALAPAWTNYTFQGKNCKGPDYLCITGNPRVDTSKVAADTNTYFNLGTMTWADQIARADKNATGTMSQLQPSLSPDGSCNTNDPKNWGDPNRAAVNGFATGACESYFPIIYAPGNLSITGNMGQGVLLVGGSLSIQGGFTFFGQIITRGTVKITGTGNHVNGGVMAASVIDSSSGSVTSGNSTIQYSKCALNSVYTATSDPARATQRNWMELF